MAFSRRRFLNALGSTAGVVVVAPWMNGPFRGVPSIEAASLSIGDFKTLVDVALDQARALGCSFASIVIERRHDASVSMRAIAKGSDGASSTKATQVPAVLESASLRVGVRVVHAGISGYAEGSSVDPQVIAVLTERAVANARAETALAPSILQHRWVAPRLTDPADMSRRHRQAFRQAVGRAVRERSGAKVERSSVTIRGEHTCYVSTRGNCTHMSQVWEA